MKIVLLKIVNAAILCKALSDMTIELLIFYKIYQRIFKDGFYILIKFLYILILIFLSK
jgi:hypothetical protein